MNVFGIGGLELIVIGLVAFLVLGPRRMAQAGKTIAKVMSELRKQRDELTSALMEEPGPDRPSNTSGKDHTGTRPLGTGRPGGSGDTDRAADTGPEDR